MQELQRAIEDLRHRAQRTNEAQALSELEQEARDLLMEAKNTPLENTAQELFAEIAGSQSTSSARPEFRRPARPGAASKNPYRNRRR